MGFTFFLKLIHRRRISARRLARMFGITASVIQTCEFCRKSFSLMDFLLFPLINPFLVMPVSPPNPIIFRIPRPLTGLIEYLNLFTRIYGGHHRLSLTLETGTMLSSSMISPDTPGYILSNSKATSYRSFLIFNSASNDNSVRRSSASSPIGAANSKP